MKKPCFRAYVISKFRNTFKTSNKKGIIEDAGIKYRDIGSVHTLFVHALYGLIAFVTLINVEYTIWGLIAVGLIFYISLIYLRYFWTRFEQLDEDGMSIDHNLFLTEKKQNIGQKGTLRINEYSKGKRILLVVEAVFVLAAVVCVFVLTRYSDGQKVIHVCDYMETTASAYQTARDYVDDQLPDAELVYHELRVYPTGNVHDFIFRNPKQGFFFNSPIDSIMLTCNDNEAKVYYWGDFKMEPISEPPSEIDMERILDVVANTMEMDQSKVEVFAVSTSVLFNKEQSSLFTDEDTWLVKVSVDQQSYNFIVHLSEGTAIPFERE